MKKLQRSFGRHFCRIVFTFSKVCDEDNRIYLLWWFMLCYIILPFCCGEEFAAFYTIQNRAKNDCAVGLWWSPRVSVPWPQVGKWCLIWDRANHRFIESNIWQRRLIGISWKKINLNCFNKIWCRRFCWSLNCTIITLIKFWY